MLSVITHTRHTNLAWLKKCEESVAAALPDGAVHKILPAYDDWAKKRLDAVYDNEFIAFVDDDDWIDPNSLKLCLDAITSTNVGIAFTNEVSVRADESIIQRHNYSREYTFVRILPRTIHHLSVIRSSAVDPRCLELHNKFGVGIDWFIRASAALVHDAIHVPMDGYYWRTYPESTTSKTHQHYCKSMDEMCYAIEDTWGFRNGSIPIYQF